MFYRLRDLSKIFTRWPSTPIESNDYNHAQFLFLLNDQTELERKQNSIIMVILLKPFEFTEKGSSELEIFLLFPIC